MIATTAEELLEMAGVVVFVYSLLDYLGRQQWHVSLAFDAVGAQTSQEMP